MNHANLLLATIGLSVASFILGLCVIIVAVPKNDTEAAA
jgi:hypothetical protein